MTNKLHVGNLSSWVTDKDLATKFARYGAVVYALSFATECPAKAVALDWQKWSIQLAPRRPVRWLNFSSYEGQIMVVSLFNVPRLAR
jgi:hypothetical protein